MTIYKGIYKVKNEQGNYDAYHFETDSSLVIDNPNRRFVSDTEKSTWNNKANSDHTHNNYRPSTWMPSWSEITGKPNLATVATSGSYNDLSSKPTIHTINDTTTTSTTNTWSAKKINDMLANVSGENHSHDASQITGLGTAATKNTGTSAGQIPVLDSSGKLVTSIMPSLAINETFSATSEADALTKPVQNGDIVVITISNSTKTYMCVDATKTIFNDKFKILYSGADSVSKAELNEELAKKSNTDHNHDARYLRADTHNDNVSISPVNGRGIKFWNSDSYKIWMSQSTDNAWGGRVTGDTTSDYNMYYKMLGVSRGFVWKTDNGNVAGITYEGDIKAKRNLSLGDNKVEIKYNSNTESVDFVFN